MDTRNKIFTVVGAIAISAAAGIGGLVLFAMPDKTRPLSRTTPTVSVRGAASTSAPAASTATTAGSTSSASASAQTSGYKDGTYSATMAYFVPSGGQNTIDANITVSGGKITAINASGNYTDGESSMYVDSFNSSVASDASGQDLASYSPSRIGGASLTTNAFDSVLDAVRSKASA